MTKKRSVNKDLHYKNIINKQKKIIQKLSKRAGRANKLEERYTDIEELLENLDDELDENSETTEKYGCPKCNGQLYVIDGERIKVYVCQNCKYRASRRFGK